MSREQIGLGTNSNKSGFRAPNMAWDDLIVWMARNWRGKMFSTRIKKLSLASTIYLFWRDHNLRFHTNSVSDIEDITHAISDQVRLKLSTYTRVEDNDLNRSLQATWNILDSILEIN